MKPIQFILVPLFLFWLGVFWVRFKKQPLIRGLVSMVLIVAIIFTVFPDSSTQLANYLGVGRGVDMVIYLSLVGLVVGGLLLYLRILKLERQIVELTRQQAIIQAQKPNKKL